MSRNTYNISIIDGESSILVGAHEADGFTIEDGELRLYVTNPTETVAAYAKGHWASVVKVEELPDADPA